MDVKITGLTSAEAERRHKAGQGNREIKPPTKTVAQIFASNIFTYFNGLFALLALGIIIVGSWKDLGFMMIIVINTAIGIIQELKSKRTLDKMALLTEQKCTVVRDGERRVTGVHDTVLGDTVAFSAGSQIFADASVIEGDVIVNESLITGEADEIAKGKGEKLISGSFVMSGECFAVLEAVGENSYASKLTIEAKKAGKRGKSEMMRSLSRLVKVIGILIIPLGAGMMAKEMSLPGRTFAEAVVHTVAALVGMIPEGLYLLTTLALLASVVRLTKKNTLVHETDCIETLARVDMLCVDKTGTITENKMTVDEVVVLIDGQTKESVSAVMADYLEPHSSDNATMEALKEHFSAEASAKALSHLPFTSTRKYGATEAPDGSTYLLGAPDVIMARDYSLISKKVDEYSAMGCRVLLLARFSGDCDTPLSSGDVYPIALILLANKIRESAGETFRYFAENNVEVKVISGDNALAVSDVARRAGIPSSEKYIDARELDTDEKIGAAALEYTVFGRVKPEQKKKLIAAMRAAGHTVAMTGDGVNDVLALKEADCSVAMASGSEVASQAAHIVLLDSDFSSMPSVVAEGRRVINNIERTASLYLWKNIFSFILTIVTLAFVLPYPLEPSQLTLISALTIGFPSFVLALEPNESLVRGRFMRNVLYRALPPAFTALLAVIGAILIGRAFSLPLHEISTVCASLVGVTGLLMLLSTSLPLNALRTALFVSMATLLVLGAIIGAKVFSFNAIPGNSAIIFAVFAAMTVPVYIGVHKMIRRIGDRIAKRKSEKRKKS
ncbi:MAG: HAD-IC family P-type ATPase [Clostridia bacterium]|nr:HAD-IC family P-type ATPase [Clostridia bacterium]